MNTTKGNIAKMWHASECAVPAQHPEQGFRIPWYLQKKFFYDTVFWPECSKSVYPSLRTIYSRLSWFRLLTCTPGWPTMQPLSAGSRGSS